MNEKNFKIAITLAIVAIIGVIGVGFAIFTTTLKINGTGTVKASSWKIKFANLKPISTTGTAKEIQAPTLSTNDTHLGDYEVSFTTPGDSISYTFDVVNDGTFNAKISSIVMGSPICTGTGETAETDKVNICKNLSYSLTYTDTGAAVAEDDTLAAKETKSLTLKLTYSADTTVEELPVNDVAVSGLETTIVYSQTE